MSATVEVEEIRSAASAETSIVSWVFEKFAGAAVGSVAGFGMDYVLALVGIKDPPDAVKNRLDKIQDGINAILSAVEQIWSRLDELLKLLSLSTEEIKTAIQESVIDPAISIIEAHYGTAKTGTAKTLAKGAPDPVPITSLGDAVQLRGKAPSAVIDTKTFAANVIGSWDIHGQIVKIARAATTSTFTKKPLLVGWTEYLLAKNRTTFYDHALTIYRTLESYFQQLLAAQFKGINLVTSAKCYDKTEAEARPIAEAYLAEVGPYLTAQADLFVKCADEIILAMFTDPAAKWLYSPGPTKASEDIRTISRRANLVRAVVYAAVGKASALNGGICGTVIGRNVEQENAASRTFTPKGFAASAGDVFGPLNAAGNVPIEWDASTDNKYATLREKSKSGFQAFHYFWPWPATLPEAGKAIDPSFDGGLTPQWYSLETMGKPDPTKPDEPKILVADFAEMRFLRGAVFSSPSAADGALVSTPAGKATTNNNENRVGYRNAEVHGIHAMRADETLSRVLAEGSLEGHMNYHLPQGDAVGFTLEFPLFRYNGSQQTLHLASELGMKLELVEDVLPNPATEDSACMLMSPRGKFWLTRTRGGASTTIPLYNTDDRGLSLWGQGSPTHLQEGHPFSADVTLEGTGGVDDLYSLVLELCVLNRLYPGFDPVDGRHAKGRITYSLKGFRMMWQ